MKRFFKRLFNPEPEDNASNTGHIYNLTIFFIIVLTFIVLGFLLCRPCNKVNGITTFLLVGGASLAGGAAIGFLFGLPRAEKFRFIKKEDYDHTTRDYSYGDNTNLEEVSDWLTKIIVGLTLIKLNVILGWIHTSAQSIDKAFNANCDKNEGINAYVFGYCTIILYFLVGAGLCYLWARTNLSSILAQYRINQRNIESKTKAQAQLQLEKNSEMQSGGHITRYLNKEIISAEQSTLDFPSDNFRSKVESVYYTKPIIDKTDLQKNRWGGKPTKGDFVLDATPITVGKNNVRIFVKSINISNPLKGEVAFFLHDTFPSQIIYTIANNDIAEFSFWAFEAFVVGAKLEDGTELELDLNQVKGFPESFYWKE